MELAVRFLLFLRKLISFFHKRWDQSTRRLWYIFALVRSRILSQWPKKRDEIRRSTEYRPAKPPTTVICASRFPPPLTPIPGGDTPIASPTPISIQVRQPTILNPADTLYETHENYSNEHLGVDGYFLEGSGPISRSLDSAAHHDEPEDIHVVIPSHREEHVVNHPVIPSRPPSRPHSGYSHRPTSQNSAQRPPSHYSHRPHSFYSHYSPSYLNGAEAAAHGYGHPNVPPSPSCSTPVRAPSIAGSVASRAHRAPRPTTRVPRPSPMRNASRRRRPSTSASTRKSVHDAPPEHPQPESRTSVSIHSDRHSMAVSFGPALPTLEPGDRLRPMIAVDRYEKQKEVVIDDVINPHTFPPVTTQFVRWVFALSSETSRVYLPSFLVTVFLTIGSPSCILRELCTGSMGQM